MNLVSKLVEQYFAVQNGELLLGTLPIREVLSLSGTPAFIYDQSILERKLGLLKQAFPPSFRICYSVKANPNQSILRFFLFHGSGLEIASGGELHQVLTAGCPPEDIIFAGPGKTEGELEYALTQGVGEIHVESRLEIERIRSLCGRLGRTARVGLRINPSAEAQGGAMRMGGKPTPFGVDEECLDDYLDLLTGEPLLRFHGIHLFSGTQILDAEVLISQYSKALQICRHIARRLGKPLKTVDLGGGLGIPYFAGDSQLDLERLRKGLSNLMSQSEGDHLLQGTKFIIEPGRFLVGEAGLYVTRIIDIKVSRGKKFLVIDGGMHHHLAASGNLGQTIKKNFPVALLNKMDHSEQEVVDIVGPLCTPLDCLGRSVTLPFAEVGDLVGIFQSGAYARTASPLGFLSHPTPAEVWVEQGACRLIRNRGEYSDFTHDLVCETLH